MAHYERKIKIKSLIKDRFKHIYKILINFILIPFGENKFIVYSFVLRFHQFLGCHNWYHKLLNQVDINNVKFVKIPVGTAVSGGKYLYVTNSYDDLRYWCRHDLGEWEFVSRHFFVSIASGCEMVLDIGAYTGVYSVETAILNPDCIVNSFEPNPRIFQNLRRNIELNELEERVKLFQISLGQQIGKAKLYLPENNGTSMATLKTGSSEYLEVPMSTLDSIHFVKSIDLIKIDVEGFESKVFLGGQNALDKFKPIILGEALTLNELRDQQLILSKYGYKEPIKVYQGTVSDSRNYIWYSKRDEFKVNSFLSKSRKEFAKFYP